MSGIAAAALGLFLLDPAHAALQPNAGTSLTRALRTDLNGYLEKRGRIEHLSALSLAISTSADRPPILVTAGTVRYGEGRAVTPSDLFQIGSNTKAFTAVAVLQLEAQGRLSIDAPIGNYLPQYPAYAKITLRQLLSMTGGIPTYDDTPAWQRAYAANPMANESPDTLIRYVYPKFSSKPGTAYLYSNTGYILAQEVVAARSVSKSFSTEMARVIASAGLRNTYYASHLYPPQIAAHVVAGYYELNEPGFRNIMGTDVSRQSMSWAQGAGSMISTPHDLVIWARQLYAGTSLLPAKQKSELLSLVSLKTAKRIGAVTPNDPAGFALGVSQRYAAQLGTFWFYQGETNGFRAAHLYFPRSGLVVAVFANSRPMEKDSQLQQLFRSIDATLKRYGVS